MAVELRAVAVEEAEEDVVLRGVHAHRAEVRAVAHHAAGHRRGVELVLAVAAEAVHEVNKPVRVDDAFVEMIVSGEDGVRAPFVEGPAHPDGLAGVGAVNRAGGIWCVMEIDELPDGGGVGELLLEPPALRGIRRGAVRLGLVGIEAEEFHGPALEGVVALVAGQREVIEVRLGVGGEPVVIAEAGKEAIGHRARAVASFISADELVVELADVAVDGGRRADGIVVIAEGEDEMWLPAFDELGDLAGRDVVGAVVADGGEGDGQGGGGGSGQGEMAEEQGPGTEE